MAQKLSTNTFTVAKWVVSSDATQGTHTTLAAALTSASSGDTILIRDGTYTQDQTLKAGVNIVALVGSELTPNVTIVGKLTMTVAGSCTVAGIRLQTNADNFLAVTGSAASIVNLENCYLNCANGTGISHTSSSSSSKINLKYCTGDIGTTGITLITSTSAGQFTCVYTRFSNSGSSTTASTFTANTAVLRNSDLPIPFSVSSTGAVDAHHTNIDVSAFNVTAFAMAGSGISFFSNSDLASGTATAITIGSGSGVQAWNCGISSSNAAAVSGAGTFTYGLITWYGSSSAVTATTKTPLAVSLNAKYNIDTNGYPQALGLPRFSAKLTTNPTNVTGDGTTYTIINDSVLTDIGSNYNNSTGVYTIPTGGDGFYCFYAACLLTGVSSTAWNTAVMQIVRKNNSAVVQKQSFYRINPGKVFEVNNQVSFTSTFMDLCSAGDTIQVNIAVGGSTKSIGVFGDAATNEYTVFSGFMVSKT